jgi:NAD(P)-dependent dehydrogenase (short-subunit alcohol dehydrogenase family)
MELRGATALLLGGSGLVGMAVARRLLSFRPGRIVVTALTRDEAEAGARELAAEAAGLEGAAGVEVEAAWGNIFLSAELAEVPRQELLANAASRRRLVD